MSQVQHPTEPTPLQIDRNTVEILQIIEKWHASGVENINTLLENGREGITLDMGAAEDGTPLKLTLNADMARGFKTGLLLAMSSLGKLPFELSPVTVVEDEPELPEGVEFFEYEESDDV